MKASRYNIIFEYNGKKMAFNSRSCALAEVDEDFFKILNNPPVDGNSGNTNLIESMKSGSYIVEDDFDELENLKMISFSGKFGNKGLGLVIAPTLSCNFACPYCYENPSKGVMSPEVQQALLDLAENTAKSKLGVSVTWYGGEPLIAKDVVFSMSEKFIDICRKYGVNYTASIITNGYLIDDEIVESMVKARILDAQVTLDGPEDVHNSRRKLKVDNGEGTFNRIVHNIKKLVNKNINVDIRVNIDKTNSETVEGLLDVLKGNQLDKCDVNFGHVRPYTSVCNSILSNCLNVEEYANTDVKLQNILRQKGFGSSGYPHYPGTKSNYCCADSLSSFVVDPKGNMYKCWNDVGNVSRKVGNVLDKESYFNSLHTKYMLWSPFKFKACEECNILPICMGGCPYEGLKKGSPDCEKWRYSLIDILKAKCRQEANL